VRRDRPGGHAIEDIGRALRLQFLDNVGLLGVDHLLHGIGGQFVVERRHDLGGLRARHGIGDAGDISRMQPRQAAVVRRDQTAGYLAGEQLDPRPRDRARAPAVGTQRARQQTPQ